ncbi:MAG: HAD hydrolase-like protein, partial [Elusimicrobia bacterium]|nr:HAD hydrolase-like protein [Elusimicrobiota bacterium]
RRDAQPGEIERLGAAYLDHLSRHAALPGAKGALEGVHEILEHLRPRADAVLALGTGNLERGARIKLAPYRLNEFFPIGGFGSDSEDRPELLRIGHRRAESAAGERIPAERVYVIGDTILDVSAARAAGYRAVAVASGGSTYEQLVAVKPDHTMRSLREAFDWLKALEAAA